MSCNLSLSSRVRQKILLLLLLKKTVPYKYCLGGFVKLRQWNLCMGLSDIYSVNVSSLITRNLAVGFFIFYKKKSKVEWGGAIVFFSVMVYVMSVASKNNILFASLEAISQPIKISTNSFFFLCNKNCHKKISICFKLYDKRVLNCPT